jgi:hypothetical protein
MRGVYRAVSAGSSTAIVASPIRSMLYKRVQFDQDLPCDLEDIVRSKGKSRYDLRTFF